MHDVINPATELVVAIGSSLSTSRRPDAAIARAQRSPAGMAAVAPADRAALLVRSPTSSASTTRSSRSSRSLNAGHTISNARWEANNVANVLGYYAGAPERLFGRQIPVPGGIDVTFKEPVGVVGIIVPWNFRCRSPAGASPRPSRPGAPSCSSRPSSTPLTAIRLG